MGGQRCRKRKKLVSKDEDNGFGEWGGYMDAKKSKLLDQFHSTEINQISNIFDGVAIFINGFTRPPIEELKKIMAAHGGVFHAYQSSSTTHIIASNLPNVKIKHMGSVPIVKPSWITDSIELGKLLDFKRYLLYSNQSVSQPKLQFPVIEKPSLNTHISTNLATEVSPSKVKSNTEVDIDISLNTNLNHVEIDTAINGNVTDQTPSAIEILGNTSEEIDVSKSLEPKTEIDRRSRASTKTASDPNFLKEFYNNSRLHLISTLGAEFKQLIGQLRDKSDGNFSGLQKLIEKGKHSGRIVSGSVIMHIDMDSFFVSVGLKNHPELKGKPIAITHARNGQIANIRPDQKANREQEFAMYGERLPIGVTSRVDKLDTHSSLSEIASCSYEARKCGIRNGMFLGQAIKMCPDLQTLPYDFEGYKEVSHILYNTVASYTLDIEAVSCDEMYVDVTKILRETGFSVDEWANHIRGEIMEITGCPCSAGFGANRLQARIATRKAKPAGQFYLRPEEVDEFMSEIPLSDLPGVGRSTLAKLMNLGLNTCGDVQVTSLKILQSEIGQKAGETIKEQAMGIDKKPLNFHHERKSVSAEVNYGIRFKTIDECYNFLQSLSNEVYNRLHDINMKARSVTLKLLVRAADAPVETAKFLGHGICDALSKSTNNIMINDSHSIFKEVKSLYEKLNPSFADLRGLGIQLTKLEKNAPMNNALCKFLKQKDVQQSTALVDKVNPVNSLVNRNHTKHQEDPSISNSEKVAECSSSKNKRARPKKNNKLKPASENPPAVNKYFSQSKGITPNTKSKQFNLEGKIDLDVLRQLPMDLQHEIIQDYQLQYTINENIEMKSSTNLETNEKNEESSKEDEANTPFANLTWDQLKLMINKWISSTSEPEEFDTIMIANHFKQFAVDRKIELLLIIFNFLYRRFSNLDCNWHKAYFTIVNIVQEGMVARYGVTLMVNRTFQCCHM